MTYLSVATMANNSVLGGRVTACVAIEGEQNPDLWVQRKRWSIAGQPGWDAAWESAKQLNPTATDAVVAGNPAVITDAMILSAVQTLRS